jgi:mannitol 2-dehydrogenase
MPVPAPIRLSTATLASIEEWGVSTPHYDRAALVPRILHLGVGGFHRAHLALYVHELAAQGGSWGICGLGRLDADRRMASVLASQDHLYTLIERDSQGSRPKIVGSIVDSVPAADEDAFARRIADPGLPSCR